MGTQDDAILINWEPASAVIQQQQKNRRSRPGSGSPKKLIPLLFEAGDQFFQVIPIEIPVEIATGPAIPSTFFTRARLSKSVISGASGSRVKVTFFYCTFV